MMPPAALDGEVFFTIGLAAAVTYLLRFGGLMLANKLPRSGRCRRFMDALPGTLLLSLIAPGIVSAGFLRKWRKGAVLGAFLTAAVLTPPDAVSQILVAVPLYALFELGIVTCALGGRRHAPAPDTAASHP